MITAIVLSLVVGVAGGWYATKRGYTTKIASIAAEVRDYENHRIAEVRNFAARVKAFL